MSTVRSEPLQDRFTQPAMAVTIDEAAHMVGLSPSHFRRIYLDTKRVRLIAVSERARVIDVDQLREAYAELRDEKWDKES